MPQVRLLNPEGSLFLYGTEKVRLTYLRNCLAGEGVCLLVFVGTQVSVTCAHAWVNGSAPAAWDPGDW